MSDATCPHCGSTSVYRETRRVPWCIGGVAWVKAGWYVCKEPSCWHKWDGIVDSQIAVLPAGVVARGKPELEEEETG